MSVLLGGADDPTSRISGVIERIRGATRDDGTPLFTPATSASVLVFFVLAMQCLSTLAVTRRRPAASSGPALQLALHVGARLRRRAHHLSGPARRRHQLRIAMTLDWQTVVVTIVALGAALVIVRRFVPGPAAIERPAGAAAAPVACDHCETGAQGHADRDGRQRIHGADADDARRQRRRPARLGRGASSDSLRSSAGRRPSRADRRRRSSRRTSRRGR